MSRLLVTFVTLCVLSRVAAAHDFWLYPSVHVLANPEVVPVRVLVGFHNDVAELERRESHIVKFEAQGAAGVVPATGVAGKSPAGYLDLPAADIYTVIYQSNFSLVELEPRKFDNYLAEEGLLSIIAEREQRRESEVVGRDSFARYAKALVRVGGATTGFDRRLGTPAELVALADPFVGGEDGMLEFQMWYLDQPHAGALVDLFLVEPNNITVVAKGTTDQQGRVKFATPGIGRYMIAATAMRRAAKPVEGDWESSWASLAFEIASLSHVKATRPWYAKPAVLGAFAGALLLAVGWWYSQRRSRK